MPARLVRVRELTVRVRGRLPRWIVPALWAACILAMATDLGSGENTGAVLDPVFSWLGFGPAAAAFFHGAFRALGHVTAYGGFALLVLWAGRPTHPRPVRLALLLAVALATVDETLQGLFVPSRVGDVADVVLDAGAAAFALWCAMHLLVPGSPLKNRREACGRPGA